jgi:1-acyl-sn-glycerol-3-phosphate acyltransferase
MRAGDVPIIPIGISGTEHVGFPRLGPFAPRVRIVYGEPFTLPSGGRRTREDLEHATDLIMRRIAALLPPAYRGVYAEPEAVPAASGTLHEDAIIGASDPLGLSRPADEDAPGEPTPPGA